MNEIDKNWLYRLDSKFGEGWLTRLVGVLLVVAGLMHLASKADMWSDTHIFVLGVLLFAVLISIFRKHPAPSEKKWLIWSFFPLIFFGFWYYFVVVFGNFSWSAILFHVSGGLDQSDAVFQYVKETKNTIIGVVTIGFGIFALKNSSAVFQRLEKWLAICILVVNPAVITAVGTATALTTEDTGFAKEYVVPEASISVGKKPKNFIHIFLESTERTLIDVNVFGSTMSPLLEFDESGLSATEMLQVEYTSWSVAGMTASYCGVPLSPVGMIRKNHFNQVDYFLPNATCLGDILVNHGYELTYIVGADPEFGGIDKLYKQHGFSRTIGFEQLVEAYADKAETKITHGRTTWGSHDDIVLLAGLDHVRRKVADKKPFGIVLETIGGHSPVGNISPSCLGRVELEDVKIDILKGMKCTNLLVKDFVDALKAEGLMDNTVVIIQSDHLGMKSKVFDELLKHERRNLFIIVGDDVAQNQISRRSTMMDIYPTLIEVLGFDLEGGAAGVGRSLLGTEKTLAERFGLDELETLIQGDRKLSHDLWAVNQK